MQVRGELAGPHVEHILDGDRLEVQSARGVVVGGDGLRVAVHHDGLKARSPDVQEELRGKGVVKEQI